MKNKNVIYYVLLSIGIGLFYVGGFILKAPELKSISGICIGIGAGLFGMSLGKIIEFRVQNKNPSYKRQMNIEAKDERNVSIKTKAKAKSFDVMGTVFGILMLIYVLIEADRLIIYLVVAAYLLVYAVYIVSINKYSKEM